MGTKSTHTCKSGLVVLNSTVHALNSSMLAPEVNKVQPAQAVAGEDREASGHHRARVDPRRHRQAQVLLPTTGVADLQGDLCPRSALHKHSPKVRCHDCSTWHLHLNGGGGSTAAAVAAVELPSASTLRHASPAQNNIDRRRITPKPPARSAFAPRPL